MCYSAMVEQGLKSGLRWKARIQTDMFEELFRRRLGDDSVKIAKALEANFEQPATPAERRIKQLIDEYRGRKAKQWETELFQHKTRLADAERALKSRQTKKVLEDKRIASNKISWSLRKLSDLRRMTPEPDDARIFPFWYAPVFVVENGECVIKPMRYHCRPNGKPEWYDRKYDGLYNARRDSLGRFWKNLFGRQHGFFLVSSFFENVALHDFQRRALRAGETPRNLVLHFNPRPAGEMIIACLWDRWQAPGRQDLYSFAAITDDPPPEVAATGHNRCVIPLRPANLDIWMTPAGVERGALARVLDDREQPYYEHELAA